jgi:redox-sensitive bicupin YhaK (pirin superfamily)
MTTAKYIAATFVGGAVGAAGMAFGAQQANATRREPQFQNSEVEVWKSTVMPNSPLAMHRHEHGRALVALTNGTLEVVDAKGTTMNKLVLEAGKAYWLDRDVPNTQHADVNKGKEPIQVVVVQLKNDKPITK